MKKQHKPKPYGTPDINKATPFTMSDLVEVMRRLRDKDTGCPWDLEQDFHSIAPHTIEEAYEVADAIERGDMRDLREELGDLLFQPVYHAQMAEEGGYFNLHDVIHDITAKMIARHPHVFEDGKAQTASDVNQIWEQKKSEEQEQKSGAVLSSSLLDGVTKALPALLRAQKLQKRAAKVGFEWPDPAQALAKLDEEMEEMAEAVRNQDRQAMEEEIGDVFFVLSNYARMLGIDAETALRRCNDKFERRFRGIEREAESKQTKLKEASLQEMESMWDAQKNKEKQSKPLS